MFAEDKENKPLTGFKGFFRNLVEFTGGEQANMDWDMFYESHKEDMGLSHYIAEYIYSPVDNSSHEDSGLVPSKQEEEDLHVWRQGDQEGVGQGSQTPVLRCRSPV